MDDVIFEEFGTGNSEIYLDRRLSDKRLYPATDLQRSGTQEELLIGKEDLNRMLVSVVVLNPLSPVEQMEVFLERSQDKTNAEFLASMQT